MENIKYGRRREGRWTPIRAKAQETRANPNSSETHLVRKRWDIRILRALNARIMMMMMICPGRRWCGVATSQLTERILSELAKGTDGNRSILTLWFANLAGG